MYNVLSEKRRPLVNLHDETDINVYKHMYSINEAAKDKKDIERTQIPLTRWCDVTKPISAVPSRYPVK